MIESDADSSLVESLPLVWTRKISANPRGIELARERRELLLWDSSHWLFLLDHSGTTQVQRLIPDLITATISDNGLALAVANVNGHVWWLARDLMTRWEKKVSSSVLSLALDPDGQYLAISDKSGHISIYNHQGKRASKFLVPRPLHHLLFLPQTPLLIGCADYGLIVGANLSGEIVWQDRPLVQVGQLSSDFSGNSLLLASFSEGLHRYNSSGKKISRLSTKEACQFVCQTASGGMILTGSVNNRLMVLDSMGRRMGSCLLDRSLLGLCCEALGKHAYAALKGGTIVKIRLPGEI